MRAGCAVQKKKKTSHHRELGAISPSLPHRLRQRPQCLPTLHAIGHRCDMLLVARIPNQPLSHNPRGVPAEERDAPSHQPCSHRGDSPPSNPHARVTVTMINPTPLISFLRQGKTKQRGGARASPRERSRFWRTVNVPTKAGRPSSCRANNSDDSLHTSSPPVRPYTRVGTITTTRQPQR
jgi:hypothetical protein